MNRVLLLFSLLISQICLSQIVIKGKISDKLTKENLIGANVVWKLQNVGVTTDFDGHYEINIPTKTFPIKLTVSYMGYSTQIITIKEEEWINKKGFYDIYLKSNNKILKEVKIVDSRLTEKQKESPLTVESLDILAIKETPSANFYDGLGALKGVDISAASLGFKIINTRGFNSTSPVRSLQIIDGVDNQAPGMNFSLGNFLGASELDILKVEIIQGASSAYFGPNAFNGVIKMDTKNPFVHTGLSFQSKFGSRNLFENSFRLAEKFQNQQGEDIFAYKINFSYMKAHDWEADNMAQVDGTEAHINNPGGYDAVNRYGDEDTDGDYNDLRNLKPDQYKDFGGLGVFHRTGYMEKDIVDYNTNNLKFSSSLHYNIKPEIEMMYKFNYGTGTTVYQGDNRFSLKNIQFFQNIMEVKKEDQFFVRAYRSQEDAGNSYDAVFTAIKLQEHNLISNQNWYSSYKNNWKNNFSLENLGWSEYESDGYFNEFGIWVGVHTFNGDTIELIEWMSLSDSVLNSNTEEIIALHELTRSQTDIETNRLIPGTEEFTSALNVITSKTPIEGGTGFYDKSALNHFHTEYQLHPKFADIKIGANFRLYSPDSKGSIFMDTTSKISNTEYGIYSGFEKDLFLKKLKVNGTFRMDKNENFDFNFSPAASLVYKSSETDIIRFSFSSAIRNPTLSDQYLFYNVGRAILIGNLNGHGVDYGENLVTVQSLINYYLPRLEDRSQDSLKFFSVDPIRPEKAKSTEIGYRTTLFDKVYIDANYYYSKYTDFIGYKVGVKYQADTSGGGYDISSPSIQAYRMAANAENIVTTQGASIGLNYYISTQFTFNGNYSWNKLNEKGTEDPIIPAYNTPEHKFNIGFAGRDINFSSNHMILRNFAFNINYKWVEGFTYEGSPQFTGQVPTYDIVDIQISKKIPEFNTTLKLGSSNLLNNLHFEVYGGPYIGRMNYISLLFELK